MGDEQRGKLLRKTSARSGRWKGAELSAEHNQSKRAGLPQAVEGATMRCEAETALPPEKPHLAIGPARQEVGSKQLRDKGTRYTDGAADV
jgi:hypothetical protein